MTDQELIDGILRQERKACQHLVEQYQHMVIKTAFYFIGNMQDAEDLSQDIFVDLIHSVKSFRGASTLQTWIYRITVNKSINFVKRKQRRDIFIRLESLFSNSQKHEEFPFEEPAEKQTVYEQKEQHEMLHAAINRLPENQRIAFVLAQFDQQSYRQIAEIMKLSLSSVESLIHRARVNLQKSLVSQFTDYQTR